MLIRLGTRASALATTQSEWFAAQLREHGHEVELVEIRTEGDVKPGSLARLGGTGVFAAALRNALLDGDCDIAVHSCKDLPTAPVPGLVIACIPVRERTDDVLCARDNLTLEGLPSGSKVGTGSPRRAAQLRALRPDLELVDIRGNVGTRLARVAPGDLDAVVLAAAGLSRLGLDEAVSDVLPILPAPAQGALAVECREGDDELLVVLAGLDHAPTRWCVEAERAILARLQAGCAAPVGALARIYDGQATIAASVMAVDGTDSRNVNRSVSMGEDPVHAGTAVAERLLEIGAAGITDLGATKAARATHSEALWSTSKPLDGLRVLMPAPLGGLANAVAAAGADVVGAELIRTEPRQDVLDTVAGVLADGWDWVVLTSARTAELLGRILDGAKVAAVGPATADAARAVGADVALCPEQAGGAAELLAVFPDGPGRVLLPGSAISAPTLREGLVDKGWDVVVMAVYDTQLVPYAGNAAVDVAVATSGSVARSLSKSGLPVVAIGAPSAAAAEALGLRVVAVAENPTPEGIVAALVAAREEL